MSLFNRQVAPALQIRTVLLSVQALLSTPNPDDLLATDDVKHCKEGEKDARIIVSFCAGFRQLGLLANTSLATAPVIFYQYPNLGRR